MADYTDNYSLAMPEEGSSNSGDAVNGNFETIDDMLMKLENVVVSNNVILKHGDNMIYHSLGV